ncbi:MAG: KH domain-containing protein [Bacilli bacterium]|nr:KH domain-containing protein [Bacilli bacterium]
MKETVFSGKTLEDVKEEALKSLGVSESEVYFYVTKTKGGLLKKEVITLHVITRDDLVDYVKDFLKGITKDMGLDVSFESKVRDEQITIKMYSDNNNILIGKEGKTLQALTTLVKQVIYNKIGEYPYILLDVENYKEKNEERLIRSAKKIAKEVAKTKVEAELENMNSYQRRLIHNALTDFKGVYTESVGEEPNRHIVIKPKEA